MMRVLVTLLLATAARLQGENVTSTESETETEAETDEEGDSAPFAVSIEQTAGRHCAGSLLAPRTVLTSAWCARAARQARAASGGAARTVLRAAAARGAAGEGGAGTGWGGVLLDLAVLELEAPFDKETAARPILVATEPGECEAPHTRCHVARSVHAPGETSGARVLVVSASVAEGGVCNVRARFWASVADRALCLVGPELCPSDWGAGVVCGGKLCGVLSRSAGLAGSAVGAGCAHTHAAQSVARWRRFLHCAHTDACGLDKCADTCTEIRLSTDEETEDLPSPPLPAPAPAPRITSPSDIGSSTYRGHHHKAIDKIDIAKTEAAQDSSENPTSAGGARTAAPEGAGGARTAALEGAGGGGDVWPRVAEFEPNRADFRAGEYGDTVVEYGEHAGDAPRPTLPPSPTPSPAPVQRRLAPEPTSPPRPPPRARSAADASLHRTVVMYFIALSLLAYKYTSDYNQ